MMKYEASEWSQEDQYTHAAYDWRGLERLELANGTGCSKHVCSRR